MPQVVLFPKHDKQWERAPEHVPWDRAYVLKMSNNPEYFQIQLQKKGSFYPKMYTEAAREMSQNYLRMKKSREESQTKAAKEARAAKESKAKAAMAAKANMDAMDARAKMQAEAKAAADVFEERTGEAIAAVLPTEAVDFDEL